MMILAFYKFFFRPMWAKIHGLEVAERPGEEDLPPLEIPAWLSLDLHGRSERSQSESGLIMSPMSPTTTYKLRTIQEGFFCVTYQRGRGVITPFSFIFHHQGMKPFKITN